MKFNKKIIKFTVDENLEDKIVFEKETIKDTMIMMLEGQELILDEALELEDKIRSICGQEKIERNQEKKKSNKWLKDSNMVIEEEWNNDRSVSGSSRSQRENSFTSSEEDEDDNFIISPEAKRRRR